jgi:predicted phage tail protein
MSKQRVKDEVKRFKSNHRGQSCEIIITAKGKTICTFEKEGVKLARAEMKLSEGDEFDYEFGVKMAKQKAYIRLADRIIEKMEKDLQEIRADKQKEIDRYNEKLEARYPGIRLRTAVKKLKKVAENMSMDTAKEPMQSTLMNSDNEIIESNPAKKLSDNSGLEAENKFKKGDWVEVLVEKAELYGVPKTLAENGFFEVLARGKETKLYLIEGGLEKYHVPEDALKEYFPF